MMGSKAAGRARVFARPGAPRTIVSIAHAMQDVPWAGGADVGSDAPGLACERFTLILPRTTSRPGFCIAAARHRPRPLPPPSCLLLLRTTGERALGRPPGRHPSIDLLLLY